MTPKEQAAMQQALEALESYSKSDYIKKQHPKRRANGEKAITALREALDHSGEDNEMVAEQAEQEPVDKTKGKNITRWVGLTAEERISCRDWDRDKCIRKTEHLLRSKNHV